MECIGIFWNLLESSGFFWNLFVSFGFFWNLFGIFWNLFNVLESFEIFEQLGWPRTREFLRVT